MPQPPPDAPPNQAQIQNIQDPWMQRKNNLPLFSPRNNKVDVVNEVSWNDNSPAVQEESKE